MIDVMFGDEGVPPEALRRPLSMAPLKSTDQHIDPSPVSGNRVRGRVVPTHARSRESMRSVVLAGYAGPGGFQSTPISRQPVSVRELWRLPGR